MDDAIGKIKSKIEYHTAEAARLQAVLDAFLKEAGIIMGGESVPPPATEGRFAKVKFQAAVLALLREKGPLSSSDIATALTDGGFPSKSEKPIANFANMLGKLAEGEIVRKSGDRSSGILWNLPE
jgi:hypothetical protein